MGGTMRSFRVGMSLVLALFALSSVVGCAECHTRHQFSIEMARKPKTCSQCHKGPDVPACAVYAVSKHGNIYESLESKWDFSAVPWPPGEHFTAPTCATCRASLLAAGGEVIAERTHRMGDRSAWAGCRGSAGPATAVSGSRGTSRSSRGPSRARMP